MWKLNDAFSLICTLKNHGEQVLGAQKSLNIILIHRWSRSTASGFNGKSRIVRLEQEQLRLYSGESDWTVRVRFRGEQTTLTLKGRRTHATAVELEWEVERSIAESLIAENDPAFVEKSRYEWRSDDGFLWEVDEFEGGLANLILAEVELPSEDTPIRIPSWVGIELTGNHGWSNSALAHRASQFTRD